LLHDLGKANAGFQAAVRATGFLAQPVRHEHLSALVLMLPEVSAWLEASSQIDIDVIAAAVLSHHLKASPDEEEGYRWCQATGATRVALHLRHADVTALLAQVGGLASLPTPPALPEAAWSDRDTRWLEAWQLGTRRARAFALQLKRDPDRRALSVAVKAALIVADAAGSGLLRCGVSPEAWIEEIAHAGALTATDLQDKVIGPCTAAISSRTGTPFVFHPFQERLADAGPRVLLVSACGSGKTLAAYCWAERQLAAQQLGKVLFLYPTRGTATEGFRDYVAWAPEDEAALLHGSSRYELEQMAANPDEKPALAGKDFGPTEAEQRLFALGFWGRRFFSATVDQFLSFLEHRYASLCMLPVLADAALIVDEVHSFDARMFDALELLIRSFDGPLLCMTATLPAERRRRLEELGLTPYPRAEDREALVELDRLEGHPRYTLRRGPSSECAFASACEGYQSRRRVLWVVNSVARCQGLAAALEEELGVAVLSYHSRFRMKDRQRVHRATVSAFQSLAPAIAVTTQVCEMSLDLDADLLISELAPVPSMIQRFGRANRHLRRGDAFRAELICYEPPRPQPYLAEDIRGASDFVAELADRDLSQRELAAALLRHGPEERRAVSGRFLTSGYFARPGAFREEDTYTSPAVLDGDLAAVEQALAERAPIDGYLINAPRGAVAAEVQRPAALPRFVRVVRSVDYDANRGLQIGGDGG
jgi:CRISPR-associated endonuclease/helicase Cas3